MIALSYRHFPRERRKLADLKFILESGFVYGPVEKTEIPDFLAACRPLHIHPFEASLGVRAVPKEKPYFLAITHDLGGLDETCQFCTTNIRYVFECEDVNKHRFHVGSECIRRNEPKGSVFYGEVKAALRLHKALRKLFFPTEKELAKAKAEQLKQRAEAEARMDAILRRVRQ